jgi:tetratricopeptide (TPR) repeat protein
LALRPRYALAWVGKGIIFRDLKRYDESHAAYDQAVAINPDLGLAWYNKALTYLQAGNYPEGWRLSEWRWQTPLQRNDVKKFPQKLWLGDEPLIGKTILIHAEQGLGDSIQFCRYLPRLKEQAAKVIFEVQRDLVSLFNSQHQGIDLVQRDSELPHFDVHCPLLSLPLAFKTTVESIPVDIPYLLPSPEKQKLWRSTLGDKKRPRIGLVWSGRPQHPNDKLRSIPLSELLPIFRADAEFHSLQKEVREQDLDLMRTSTTVIDHAAALTDFSDTAALVGEMDLVISVDTSVAHLAGAMGKAVWILLPFAADFRWMADREDSPWYPTAKLFRQQRPGDWPEVIERVAALVREL